MISLNNLNLRTKLLGGFIFVLALTAVIAAVVFANINRMVTSTKWVNHTYEVIRVAESVGAAMIDMETGQRGFMITGKDEYLEPYNDGKRVFEGYIQKGKELTSDNPKQGGRWDKVAELKQRWLAEAAEPEIKARRDVSAGMDAVNEFRVISARTVGKDIFDSIRAALANLEQQLADSPEGLNLVTLTTLALVNMETGQRGFLLTGKEESLEPYVTGQKKLNTHVETLTSRAAEFDLAAADVQLALDRVNKWMEQAAKPEIDARRRMNQYKLTMNDITLLMQNGSGKSIMDQLRATLDEIVAEEEMLIAVRGDE